MILEFYTFYLNISVVAYLQSLTSNIYLTLVKIFWNEQKHSVCGRLGNWTPPTLNDRLRLSKAPFTCADLHTVCKLYIYMYNLHPVYFWACERNCIYVKVNLHMCKYTPPCKYTPAQTRCIFAFAYMYFLHVCIFGHVNAQQIYTRMQM